jgi:hypothetical protein
MRICSTRLGLAEDNTGNNIGEELKSGSSEKRR